MKKIYSWVAFLISLFISFFLLFLQTKSSFSIIIISGIIVIIGYLTQELLNKIFKKQIYKIYDIFIIKEIDIPKWITRFRVFCISVAITCFMSSFGVDLTTDFIKGNEIYIKEINVLLQDLTLFFIFIGIIPQIIWIFNYSNMT